jgi:hypothetical protein
MKLFHLGCCALLFLGSAPVWAEAGRLQFVYGDVSITRAKGERVTARKGDFVEEGDILSTGKTAQAQLLMKDDGMIAMRPDSQMQIEVYRFTGKVDGTEQGVYSLLRGGFRAITGLIGSRNKDNYKIRTATATIGIRGTDHDVLYIPQPAPGETPIGPPGTYNKVNVGSTYLQTPAGRIELTGNQVGFAPSTGNFAPSRLPSIPTFLQSTPPIRQATNTANSSDAPPTASTGDNTSSSSTSAPATTTTTSTSSTNSAPTVAIVTPTPTGAFNPANPTIGSVTAPSGTVIAGGGVGAQGVNSGAGAIGDASNSLSLLVDATGAPLTVVGNKFSYNRNGAPYLMSGSNTTLTNQKVQWGIYDGGAMTDNGVTFSNVKFFWMTATSATTAANLSVALANSNSMSFNGVEGFTTPITETGAVGGSVSSIAITIDNANGAPAISKYDIGVSDAASRIWSANLTATQSLASFMSGGNQNLTVTCSSCAAGASSGNAQGVVIGNPTPSGMVSSYKMSAGTASVGGSVLAVEGSPQ